LPPVLDGKVGQAGQEELVVEERGEDRDEAAAGPDRGIRVRTHGDPRPGEVELRKVHHPEIDVVIQDDGRRGAVCGWRGGKDRRESDAEKQPKGRGQPA
jgi:hypothetical protein